MILEITKDDDGEFLIKGSSDTLKHIANLMESIAKDGDGYSISAAYINGGLCIECDESLTD